MLFYLFHFSLNMLAGKFFLFYRKKSWYKVFTIVQLTLIAGLRAGSVGIDTYTYISYFERLEGAQSAAEAIRRLNWVEPGYALLNYIAYILGGNAHAVFFVCAAVIYVLSVDFIFEYSESPVWGMFFLFTFPFFYDSMCFIRSTMAGTVFLFSLRYVKQRQFIKYLLTISVGAMFHIMLVLCLPLYVIHKINWKRRRSIVAFLLLDMVAFLCILPIRDFVMWVLRRETYSGYTGINYWIGQNSGGWRTAIFFTVFFLGAYYFYYVRGKPTDDENLLAGYGFCLPLCALLFPTAQVIIRFMILFMPVCGAFIARELSLIQTRNNRIIMKWFYFLLGTAFHIYTISNNALGFVPYVPLWK